MERMRTQPTCDLCMERPCNCVDEAEAFRMLRAGIVTAESHPACIDFHFKNGVLTLWEGSYDYPRRWSWKSTSTATPESEKS